eukprot:5076507-Pleurochrysis_carterae.AAC.1
MSPTAAAKSCAAVRGRTPASPSLAVNPTMRVNAVLPLSHPCARPPATRTGAAVARAVYVLPVPRQLPPLAAAAASTA